MELLNGSGKAIFSKQAREISAVNALGGDTFPAFAQVDLGLDLPAGEYTLVLTVTDKSGKCPTTLKQPFAVLPKGFGLVRVTATCDPEGQVPTGAFTVGQTAWVHGAVVGFDWPYGYASSGFVVNNVVNAHAASLWQQAHQAKLDTRRKLFDQLRYEQMMTPTYEELHQAAVAERFFRARNYPPRRTLSRGTSSTI